jgi:hypothetical protein
LQDDPTLVDWFPDIPHVDLAYPPFSDGEDTLAMSGPLPLSVSAGYQPIQWETGGVAQTGLDGNLPLHDWHEGAQAHGYDPMYGAEQAFNGSSIQSSDMGSGDADGYQLLGESPVYFDYYWPTYPVQTSPSDMASCTGIYTPLQYDVPTDYVPPIDPALELSKAPVIGSGDASGYPSLDHPTARFDDYLLDATAQISPSDMASTAAIYTPLQYGGNPNDVPPIDPALDT